MIVAGFLDPIGPRPSDIGDAASPDRSHGFAHDESMPRGVRRATEGLRRSTRTMRPRRHEGQVSKDSPVRIS